MMLHPPVYRRLDGDTGVHTIDTTLVRGRALDCWLVHPWHRGVQIDRVDALHAFRVRTRNSTYDLAVVPGAPGEVLVRGGRYFPEWTRVHLAGSTLGGSLLKRYGVHVGLRMEFHWHTRRVVTSPVHAISSIPVAQPA